MRAACSESLSAAEVTQRARLRTMRERRKRLWQRVVVFAVAAIVLLLAVLAGRDWTLARDIGREATLVTDALQVSYERNGYLPVLFPDSGESFPRLRERYVFNMLYAEETRWRSKVGVCCSKKPVRFFLRSDVRVLVFFDRERFGWELISESRLRNEAEGLGFGSLLDR